MILSDTDSEHTEKWALGLANKGIEVGLFSFNKASYEWHTHPNITVFFEPEKRINAESTLTKLAYLKHVNVLKGIIKHFKPDVLHAHYATSYGLVGALSGFHPYIISSWGTDVMKFPNKNFVAKSILKYNFKAADILCATSETVKESIQRVIKKEVLVVPFGVDTDVFLPKKVKSLFAEEDFVLGSIKSLEELYNIDILIKSFAVLSKKYPRLKLLIAGEGSAKENLIKLTEKLNVTQAVVFAGRIPFNEISSYYNMIDVLVNISEYESFGVSVIEAMACEKPVIVTNVGGLKGIVKDESLGYKVDVRNETQTIAAIEELICDKVKYKQIAENSRKHVVTNYSWKMSLEQMTTIYKKIISTKASQREVIEK
ncbi:glycosyltransferase [Aurantibacillus circumpalustris]|uniref:glycosyltransferase n=1 Tax=Aurantibacillus circumpalustris TaxID=3036359 RepID=UPI00295B61A4|nr:glycosyltransferase [Aurantibacillus circumpalustris]